MLGCPKNSVVFLNCHLLFTLATDELLCLKNNPWQLKKKNPGGQFGVTSWTALQIQPSSIKKTTFAEECILNSTKAKKAVILKY